MNKSLAYTVIGVIAVVLIGGLVLFRQRAGAPTGGDGSSVTGGLTSLKELVAQGKSQKCTFASEEAASSNGTVYMATGHVRGDFTSTAGSSQKVESHMIVDGQTAYLWSNAMPQGIKIAFAKVGTQSGTGQSTGISADQKTNYSCESWTVDQSKFALPSGITFMDMAATMPAGTGAPGSGAGNSAYCSQCNSLPDTNAKAQCRAAYHCQ